jgi:hypothetical protein
MPARRDPPLRPEIGFHLRGLDPRIHVFRPQAGSRKDVDDRIKPGQRLRMVAAKFYVTTAAKLDSHIA